MASMVPSSRWVLALIAVTVLISMGSGDQVRHLDAHPDDPALVGGSQWPLDVIGAPTAWHRATGRGSTIAIVDSGVDAAQIDLRSNVVESVDCIGAGGNPDRCAGSGRDEDGHGTHVAGIAAATFDNGHGIAGVAPDAHLLGVRVLADACETPRCTASGDTLDVVAGIRWATAHGADVINLSLGSADGSLDQPAFAAAVSDAWKAGVVVVAAAGNRRMTAGLDDLPILVVTAVDRDLAPASYSRGVGTARWGLAAPGGEAGDTARSCRDTGRPVGVLSTSAGPAGGGERYACLAGTSMAAPHVAGAVAVLLSMGYSPVAAVRRLLSTARDLGRSGPDPVYGSGLLALDRASRPANEPLDRRETLRSGGTASAVGDSVTMAGTVAPRPQRLPLLPVVFGGSLIAFCGAGALMLGRHLWQERPG